MTQKSVKQPLDVETDSNNWKVLQGMAEIHMLDNQLSALTKKQIKIRLLETERAAAMIGSDSESEGEGDDDNDDENENENDDFGDVGDEEGEIKDKR